MVRKKIKVKQWCQDFRILKIHLQADDNTQNIFCVKFELSSMHLVYPIVTTKGLTSLTLGAQLFSLPTFR